MKLNSPPILIILLLGSMMFFTQSAKAALTLDVASSISDVRPGETARVEFTVSNTDGSSRNDVVMTLVFPAGLNAYSEANFDGDCISISCTVGETVTWSLGSIPSGGSTTVFMAPTVNISAVNGSVIALDATVTDSSLDSVMGSADITVDADMSFDVSLSETNDPATPGSSLTYQIDYGYRDDAASVTNSTLEFTLPANSTFVLASSGGTLNGSTVSWPLGFLSPGDSGIAQVEVLLDAGLQSGDALGAAANLFSVNTPTTNAVSTQVTSISATPGIQLSIENNRDQARGGGTVSYVLSVTNTDPFTRFGVQIDALYPNSLNALSEATFDGDCGSTSCTEGERMTWTLGDIPSGATRRVEMPVTVNASSSAGELINFDVTVSDVAGLLTRESEVVRVNNNTVYEVILSESREPIVAGDELSYRIDFSYRGDAASVNNTELVVSLPTGVTFSSASDGGQLSGSDVSWNLGFLSPGQGGTRHISVVSDSGLSNATVLNARATLRSVTTASQFAVSEADTSVSSSSGLQVEIETSLSPARPGHAMSYQLVVSNTDPFTRFGVDMTLIYPNEFNALSEASFDGDCGSISCTGGERVTWQLGNIPAGQAVTVDMPSVLSTAALNGRLIPMRVLVEDDQGAQSFKSETLRVQDDARFELALADNSDPVVSGSEFAYTVKFSYREDTAGVAQNQLSLQLPSGVSFVSGTDGAVHSNGVVTWNLGFMSPGDSGRRDVKVAVDGTVPNTSVLSAIARMTTVADSIQTTRTERSTVVAATRGLQVSMVSNPDTIRSSELSDYQISVINHDPFTRFGVDLTGLFPLGVGALSELEFGGDCGSVSCTSGELVTWLLGDIRPGESKTVNLPMVLSPSQAGGDLVEFNARVADDQGVQSRHSASLRVQNDTVYDVAVDSSADPVAAGSQLAYRVTYGYRQDAGQINNSSLRLPIPDGTTFVSASAGGVVVGDAVEWALGNLAPGEGGIVEAVVSVDAGLLNGTVVQTAAKLFSTSAAFEAATAEAASIVLNQSPLDLRARALTFTAEADRELAILFTVTNNDVFARFNVNLSARMPQGLATLFENNPQFDGDCSSTSCVAGELVQWVIGELPAGATASVLLPPSVLGTAVDGTVTSFEAWVTDQQDAEARAGVAVYTGCLDALDGDCDGVVNTVDNCSLVGNTQQRDTDGDGFGNLCDPDLNNDLIVNFIDISLFAGLFLSTDADADFNGDGAVNFLDYVIMTSFFLSPPGPGAEMN